MYKCDLSEIVSLKIYDIPTKNEPGFTDMFCGLGSYPRDYCLACTLVATDWTERNRYTKHLNKYLIHVFAECLVPLTYKAIGTCT